VRPFVVFALPRSRTAWLSKYLAYGGERVGHDVAAKSRSVDDFFRNFDDGMIGMVETGAMAGWRLLRERFPAAAIAVVRRPIEDVKLSLSQFGIAPRAGDLEARDALLDEIEREPGVLSMTFRDLYEQKNRRRMFEHCLIYGWKPAWDAQWAHVNVQIDFPQALRDVAENQVAIVAMKQELAAHFNHA
jgi:hypothetical protein